MVAFRFRKLISAALRAIFPLECVACGREGFYACPACLSAVPTLGPLDLIRRDCHPLSAVWAGFSYSAPLIRGLMRDWKFGRQDDSGGYREAGTAMESLVRRTAFKYGSALSEAADVIVPVPMHAARFRERGFNQAEVIGRALSSSIGSPLVASALRRVTHAPPRTLAAERKAASPVVGAFAIGTSEDIRARRILLVDDVWTTGATMRECARVLTSAGAKSVTAFALASAIRSDCK